MTDEEKHQRQMEVIFELVCRLAMELEADFVALCDTTCRAADLVPEDRPIAQAVDDVPRIGVFSPSVLADFGGLDATYDDPWYVATLEDGRTVVVESASPWSDGGWEPPTEADYLETAEFPDPTADRSSGPSTVSDPFAGLETGAFGAEVGMHPDDISSEFTNDVLQVIRVYVGEERNLRRVEDDSFVRNVVDEAGDDVELVKGMLADVPRDASADDELVSALLHKAIPPTFVRLDGPDGENVVTTVLDMDVDVSKHDLLVSLGSVASREDFTAEDLREMEAMLDKMAGLEDVEGIERAIEKRVYGPDR